MDIDIDIAAILGTRYVLRIQVYADCLLSKDLHSQ